MRKITDFAAKTRRGFVSDLFRAATSGDKPSLFYTSHRSSNDPGQLAWPVKEFAEVRRASGRTPATPARLSGR
jgi:hypothetical protein